jgi:hypothetical protein
MIPCFDRVVDKSKSLHVAGSEVLSKKSLSNVKVLSEDV